MAQYIVYACGAVPAGGLSDRLKGLISCYGLSVALGCEFIADWTFPYPLQQVLQPNEVDWLPRPITGTLKNCFVMDNENLEWFKPVLSDTKNCLKEEIIVIRTNLNFLSYLNMQDKFEEYFKKLFKKPKFSLPIGPKTLGVCARFGGIQANWADSDFNRQLSFEDVIEKTQTIFKQGNYDNLFVCSDSTKFIETASTHLDFMCTAGASEHMDRQQCSFEGFKKSFDDFFGLRECADIISTKGEFAITAALSNGKKVIQI